jgi:hypothetical protein
MLEAKLREMNGSATEVCKTTVARLLSGITVSAMADTVCMALDLLKRK